MEEFTVSGRLRSARSSRDSQYEIFGNRQALHRLDETCEMSVLSQGPSSSCTISGGGSTPNAKMMLAGWYRKNP
jgi:hypothetical protein